jgi:hypothetical protein
MPSDDDQTRIYAQLSSAFQKRHGVIDGVEIDLRHESLKRGVWIPPLFGDSPEPAPGAPYIWFPWFGDFDSRSLQREAEEAVAKQLTAMLHGNSVVAPEVEAKNSSGAGGKPPEAKPLIEQYVRSHTPECFVQKGDRIYVKEVSSVLTGDEFSHPHDREVRNAHLLIKRANGDSEGINTPLIFILANTLLNDNNSQSTFGAIIGRILEKFGLESIENIETVTGDSSYAYHALQEAHTLWLLGRDRHEDRIEGEIDVVSPLFTSKEFLKGDNPALAVGNAIMLGYLWAKAEFQSIGSPIVELARAKAARSSVGGIKGTETRRRKSEEGWRLIAREMAIKIRAEMPESSQDKVAGEIDTRWKVEEPKAPSHQTLKKFVAELERSGRLQKPQRG